MKTPETYTSRDLTIVAYLVSSGFPLESYKKTEEGLTLFSFSKSQALELHVNNFYKMTAMINPTVYSNTLRSLKADLPPFYVPT
jgi:hypothetical protein